MYLTIENHLDGVITLSWVNGNEEREYAKIKPGQSYQQHTFEGHIWRVANAEDQTLAVIEGDADDNFYSITPEQVQLTLQQSEQANQSEQSSTFWQKNRKQGIFSPDEKWRVLVRKNNVYLIETASEEETALTQDGTGKDGYEPMVF